MPWHNLAQIEAWLEAGTTHPLLDQWFALSRLIESANYPPTFRASDTYAAAICPSEEARAILVADPTLSKESSPADLALALLGYFFHHTPLIDTSTSDFNKVVNQFSLDIRARRILLAHRFGRDLYDKFNDMATGESTQFLESPEVEALLAGTEQGVYQVGALVTGPLGLLESQEQRFLPPSLVLPLWHCSDTGCSALHNVELRGSECPAVSAYKRIERAANDSLGPPSEWLTPFRRMHRSGRWPHGRPYFDLPALIADAIVGDERTVLLSVALRTDAAGRLRKALSEMLAALRKRGKSAVGSLTPPPSLRRAA